MSGSYFSNHRGSPNHNTNINLYISRRQSDQKVSSEVFKFGDDKPLNKKQEQAKAGSTRKGSAEVRSSFSSLSISGNQQFFPDEKLLSSFISQKHSNSTKHLSETALLPNSIFFPKSIMDSKQLIKKNIEGSIWNSSSHVNASNSKFLSSSKSNYKIDHSTTGMRNNLPQPHDTQSDSQITLEAQEKSSEKENDILFFSKYKNNIDETPQSVKTNLNNNKYQVSNPFEHETNLSKSPSQICKSKVQQNSIADGFNQLEPSLIHQNSQNSYLRHNSSKIDKNEGTSHIQNSSKTITSQRFNDIFQQKTRLLQQTREVQREGSFVSSPPSLLKNMLVSPDFGNIKAGEFQELGFPHTTKNTSHNVDKESVESISLYNSFQDQINSQELEEKPQLNMQASDQKASAKKQMVSPQGLVGSIVNFKKNKKKGEECKLPLQRLSTQKSHLEINQQLSLQTQQSSQSSPMQQLQFSPKHQLKRMSSFKEQSQQVCQNSNSSSNNSSNTCEQKQIKREMHSLQAEVTHLKNQNAYLAEKVECLEKEKVHFKSIASKKQVDCDSLIEQLSTLKQQIENLKASRLINQTSQESTLTSKPYQQILTNISALETPRQINQPIQQVQASHQLACHSSNVNLTQQFSALSNQPFVMNQQSQIFNTKNSSIHNKIPPSTSNNNNSSSNNNTCNNINNNTNHVNNGNPNNNISNSNNSNSNNYSNNMNSNNSIGQRQQNLSQKQQGFVNSAPVQQNSLSIQGVTPLPFDQIQIQPNSSTSKRQNNCNVGTSAQLIQQQQQQNQNNFNQIQQNNKTAPKYKNDLLPSQNLVTHQIKNSKNSPLLQAASAQGCSSPIENENNLAGKTQILSPIGNKEEKSDFISNSILEDIPTTESQYRTMNNSLIIPTVPNGDQFSLQIELIPKKSFTKRQDSYNF